MEPLKPHLFWTTSASVPGLWIGIEARSTPSLPKKQIFCFCNLLWIAPSEVFPTTTTPLPFRTLQSLMLFASTSFTFMRYPLFSCPLCHIIRIQKLSPHACLRTYIALIYSLFVVLHIVVVRVFHQSLETCLCEFLNLYKCIAQTWNMLPFGARLLLDLKVLTHPPSPDQFSHAPHLYTHTHTMHISFTPFEGISFNSSLLGSYGDIWFSDFFFLDESRSFFISIHMYQNTMIFV